MTPFLRSKLCILRPLPKAPWNFCPNSTVLAVHAAFSLLRCTQARARWLGPVPWRPGYILPSTRSVGTQPATMDFAFPVLPERHIDSNQVLRSSTALPDIAQSCLWAWRAHVSLAMAA